MRIRVFMIDDHALFRTALRALIESQSDLQLVGEAASPKAAHALLPSCRPEVILLDVSMPKGDGLDSIRAVRRLAPFSRILMVTMHAREDYVARALSEGATGYVLKQQTTEETFKAIRAVARGDRYTPPGLDSSAGSASPLDRLSRREREVFYLAIRGYSSEGLAKELGIEPGTAEAHKNRIHKKLGTKNIGDLVRIAVRYGRLADLEPEPPPTSRALISRIKNPPS